MTVETPNVSAVLIGEHTAIDAVLGYLDRACQIVTDGRYVDAGIFRDMLKFVLLFVGECHHGKEEQILFPVLLHESARTDSVIARLEEEHTQGTALANAFAEAVADYVVRGMDAAAPLVASARAYIAFLRRHIAFENEELLEQVESIGSPDALRAALASFDRFEDEVMGAGTHQQLHQMIDTLGPRVAAAAG